MSTEKSVALDGSIDPFEDIARMAAEDEAKAKKVTPKPEAEVPEKEVIIDDTDDPDDEKVNKIVFKKSFHVSWTNPDTGKVFRGNFTAKRLTLGEQGQAGVLKASLNGGAPVDMSTDALHEMLATVQLSLVISPPWWKPETFFDSTLLVAVYQEVRKFHATFRRAVG